MLLVPIQFELQRSHWAPKPKEFIRRCSQTLVTASFLNDRRVVDVTQQGGVSWKILQRDLDRGSSSQSKILMPMPDKRLDLAFVKAPDY
jgi:hypothetical protein